ncbi:SAM-dependent methyltransferase [Alphaproteobacteria bacterium]|nr:SAM-dependent methyltransferase [Alphaproteobacteria bacterium]
MNIKKNLIDKIKKNGSLNLAEFIQICQFENDGYYLKNNPIGRANDFITSPEISQMFGEILAVFLINYWKKNIKTNFNLVELGPGKGTLLKDILRTSSINKKFLNSMNLTLIEKNKSLINIQKKILDSENITWCEEFDISNKNIPSIIYSNEFFDCFPVQQFHKKEKWYEKYVNYNEVEQNFTLVSQQVEDKKILKYLEKFDSVKVAEIARSRDEYFKLVCKFIKKHKGVFITIDYGYKNLPDHLSLQTIYQHKKTHLFENIGNQDITAHVNFDEFIFIANECNLKIETFCSQKDFLISCGIQERKKNLLKNKNDETVKKINTEYDRLVENSQMGEIFKVLVISCF